MLYLLIVLLKVSCQYRRNRTFALRPQTANATITPYTVIDSGKVELTTIYFGRSLGNFLRGTLAQNRTESEGFGVLVTATVSNVFRKPISSKVISSDMGSVTLIVSFIMHLTITEHSRCSSPRSRELSYFHSATYKYYSKKI